MLNTQTRSIIAAIIRPEAYTSFAVIPSEIATAAIAFIGCTGMGIVKMSPVNRLKAPAQKSIAEKESPVINANPRIMGRKVPRSPREPESSCLSNFATERFDLNCPKIDLINAETRF